MEGETIMMQDLFEFVRTGIDKEGYILGQFRTTGIRSFYTAQIQNVGYRGGEAAQSPRAS
jgi:pilus assembly protein CpaF